MKLDNKLIRLAVILGKDTLNYLEISARKKEISKINKICNCDEYILESSMLKVVINNCLRIDYFRFTHSNTNIPSHNRY